MRQILRRHKTPWHNFLRQPIREHVLPLCAPTSAPDRQVIAVGLALAFYLDFFPTHSITNPGSPLFTIQNQWPQHATNYMCRWMLYGMVTTRAFTVDMALSATAAMALASAKRNARRKLPCSPVPGCLHAWGMPPSAPGPSTS